MSRGPAPAYGATLELPRPVERPASRAYRTEVLAVTRLSSTFTRFTLGGPDLVHFGADGFDQRIKLLLPRADGTLPDLGLFEDPAPPVAQWYGAWRLLPDAERNPIRTYTLRAARPERAEVDIDFVLHGSEGPASAWAISARPGDELVIFGPDARVGSTGGGVEWHPGAARSVLLAGDETAAPAICAILERLDESYTGHAFIEVPEAGDVLLARAPSGVRVRWLPRLGRAHGSELDAAVRAWGREVGLAAGVTHREGRERGEAGRRADVSTVERHGAPVPQQPADDGPLWDVPTTDPQADLVADPATARYAWLAGEAGVITGLRRHLVRDLGVDRRSVAFMGYWRHGRAEGS